MKKSEIAGLFLLTVLIVGAAFFFNRDATKGITFSPELSDTSTISSRLSTTTNPNQQALGSYGDDVTARLAEQFSALWLRAIATTQNPADASDAQDLLRKHAANDPSIVRKIIARYSPNQDSQSRALVIEILASIESNAVRSFATQLVASKSVEERQDGWLILKKLPKKTAEGQQTIVHALETETAPDLLVHIIDALPTASGKEVVPLLEPQEAAQQPFSANAKQALDTSPLINQDAVIKILRVLSQNEDARVRQNSLLQLAQRDESSSSELIFLRALNDKNQEVRQTAIFAVARASHTESAKQALVQIALNANEATHIRASAAQGLSSFRLSSTEAAALAQLQPELLRGR